MRRTVLVVDDDAATRRLYTAFLQGTHEVVSVDTGVAAVETVEARNVDLVLMDLNLPGLDGWMAISLIRARRPTLPFLIVSSANDPDIESRARSVGAAAFLRKPVTADVLRTAVGRALP
jgi:CheY-like chemotaxis protein